MSTVTSAIARGYTSSDKGLQVGMVVSLVGQTDDSKQVERASQTDQDKIVGVVTSGGVGISVASQGTDVLVTTEGDVTVYVSDLNGSVTEGDLLVLSPLRGILMKAPDSGGGIIVGIAVEALKEGSSLPYPLENTNNGARETNVGSIKANLNRLGTAAGSEKKSFLQELGRSVVGRDVSSVRVLIALVLFVAVLIVEGSIIYGAVSSAVTALGRNPMAQKVIKRQLLQISVVAVSVLMLGLSAVYGILWL